MNVNYMTEAGRTRLKLAIAERRDYLATLIKWMESNGFANNDPILSSLRAANHSLHAAVNSFPQAPRKALCIRDEAEGLPPMGEAKGEGEPAAWVTARGT